MDNDDDSKDYGYGKFSDSYGGLGTNSPSFSNSSDISNIKSTIEKSRAEQTSSNRGIVNDEEEEEKEDKKESELDNKDKLEDKDSKDEKKEVKEEKKDDNKDSKNNKKKSGGLLSKKDDLNPLNKLKGKFNLLKTKLILWGILAVLGAISTLFFIGVFIGIAAAIGGGISDDANSQYVPEEEAVVDDETTSNEIDESNEETEETENSDID